MGTSPGDGVRPDNEISESAKADALQSEDLTGLEPVVKDYHSFKLTSYSPDLFTTHLQNKLGELGEVTISPGDLPEVITVDITLKQPYKVTDCNDAYLEGGLLISSEGGGCFMQPPIVNCRILPNESDPTCRFEFDFGLSTHFTPIEEHSAQLIKDTIDEFVEKAKVGFCYHFGGRLDRRR